MREFQGYMVLVLLSLLLLHAEKSTSVKLLNGVMAIIWLAGAMIALWVKT